MAEIKTIIEKQKEFFASGATLDLSLRIKKLKLLYGAIESNLQLVEKALYDDLNKSEFEAYETEIGIVLEEIRSVIKKLPKWARQKKVKSPILHFPSSSYVLMEPYGIVLIMSPWNYPFQLTLMPLIGAIAAGNCAVIKPSQYSVNTSLAVEKIIKEVFPENYAAVIQGGREANKALLEQSFDYIFFTGSPKVGHVVMESAAKHLTPMTLELGGKSPCIVDKTAAIDLTAKRIIWGKLINCGQTCIAPDYIIVQAEVKDQLVTCLKKYIEKFYGQDPIKSQDYPKIINKKHFDRLKGLMADEEIIYGGQTDEINLKIAPSIINEPLWTSPVMSEEIFGPLIPVLTFDNYDSLIKLLRQKEKPLALYLFTTDKNAEKLVTKEISFGGGSVNDTLIHICNSNMGFGGVGQSGMGQYHGRLSFETFSHRKGIMKKSNLIDINLRYPPYKNKVGLLKKLLK